MVEKYVKYFRKNWIEFREQSDGSIWIFYTRHGEGYKFTKEEVEELKEWLEEALNQRYEVKTHSSIRGKNIVYATIYDNELNETAVTFYPVSGFDCIVRAEKYCEQLNEGL